MEDNRQPEVMQNDLQADGEKYGLISMVLGIIGVTICQICGIIALVFAKKARENGVDNTQVKAGYVLGIIGTVMLGLTVLIVIIYAIFLGALLG